MTVQPHVLYIENNEYNQRLIKKILEPAGFKLSQALDGIQGIKKAIDLEPDLILMDLDLPFLDGLGATAKIKSVPELSHVPVIALISQASLRDRDRALVAGCDGYIDKPIRAASLTDQIRGYLGGKRQSCETAGKAKILMDIHANLVDQLQSQNEELQKINLELLSSKEDLLAAYERSQSLNQEMRNLNSLKENIVAITSHELRTPLSLAIGYLDLVMDGTFGETNGEQSRYLAIAKESLRKLGELVDKITDFNRISLKKIPMNLEPLDLNQSFRNVFREVALFIKIRRLCVFEELSPEPVLVMADASLVSQVFSNLLRNAICFTPDGGQIRATSWVDDGRAYFCIKDSGIGLKEEHLEAIFDEFYQVTDIHRHKTGQFEFLTRGIGVGLSLCRGIVTELGGKIRAESDGLGKGASFTFNLPLVQKS